MTALKAFSALLLAAICGALGAEYVQKFDPPKVLSGGEALAAGDRSATATGEGKTYIFVGLLLLRDAAKCEDRAAIAERFVLDAVPEFEARYMKVTSLDGTLIDHRRAIIDY